MKILILQIASTNNGGVYFVNKTLMNGFNKAGHDSIIVSIRKGRTIATDDIIINNSKSWNFIRKRDIYQSFKNFRFINSSKLLINYINERIGLYKDYVKLKKYIKQYNPDKIIISHYECLYGIPKKYLSRCYNVHHSAYDTLKIFRKNKKLLYKLKNSIKMVWLTKSSCDMAIKDGFSNSIYMYNPLKFSSSEIANVVDNKRICVISRLGSEKRIDLMINIVSDIFKDEKYRDWKFYIFGSGENEEDIKKMLRDNTQIKYLGNTSNVKKELLLSSINLNTSLYEGFSLSILEGYECGIPIVSFNYGESVFEEIIDNETGFIAEMDNISQFKEKLILLMDNPKLLKEMSLNAKNFAKSFNQDAIVSKWLELFSK